MQNDLVGMVQEAHAEREEYKAIVADLQGSMQQQSYSSSNEARHREEVLAP